VKATYRYIADGTKAGVKDSAGKGFDYLGTFVYTNENNVRTLESTNFGGGRINKTNNAYDINYFITDHLGSTRVIVDANGTVKGQYNYYPFGKQWEDINLMANTNRYTFSGKEKQTVRDLGWLDFMARMYANSEIPRFTTQDPLSEKYYSISPYAYCGNNPINVIDPDGREGIVVTGSPGKEKMDQHFLINGLDRAKKAQARTEKGEGTAWIIYNDKEQGFNQEYLDKYAEQAKEAGINVKVVSEVGDVVNYINDKTGGDSRSNDQISSFYYVGHSTPGDLDVGYQGSGQTFDPSDLSSNAFKSGAWVNVVGGCNTAVDFTILGITFEKSIIRQFADILDKKSTINGSNVTIWYPGGVAADKSLLRKHNGKIITINGTR
jgi:RHS repeat-associated protein